MRYIDAGGSPLARAFGERLRTRRQELGMSLSAVFQKTSITVSYISAVERGLSNPSLNVIEKLSEAVGCSVSEMLRSDDNPPMNAAFMAGMKPSIRGEPESAPSKEEVKLLLDAATVAHLRSSGSGWENRVNVALAEMVATGRI